MQTELLQRLQTAKPGSKELLDAVDQVMDLAEQLGKVREVDAELSRILQARKIPIRKHGWRPSAQMRCLKDSKPPEIQDDWKPSPSKVYKRPPVYVGAHDARNHGVQDSE